MEADDTCLLNVLNETGPSTSYKSQTEEICLTQNMLSNLTTEKDTEIHSQCEEEEGLLSSHFVQPTYLEEEMIDEDVLNMMVKFEIKEKISLEALQYVTGFVAHKFKTNILLEFQQKNWIQPKHLPGSE